MKDTACAYCGNQEALGKFGIFICELKETNLYLFKEQSHKGRVILADKEHVNDITDLTDERRNAFFEDVNTVSKAIQKLYHPHKVNYGMYNDGGKHLHIHLVPKYVDGFEFGGVFQMNPEKTYLTEEEYSQMVQEIKENVQ